MTARSVESNTKFPPGLAWHPGSDDCGYTPREVSHKNTLRVEVCASARCVLVTCAGPLIEGTISALSRELENLTKQSRTEYSQIVINLRDVHLINQDGYYELMHWKEVFTQKGGDVRLANVMNPNQFEQEMRSFGKPNLFKIFPNPAEAVASY